MVWYMRGQVGTFVLVPVLGLGLVHVESICCALQIVGG